MFRLLQERAVFGTAALDLLWRNDDRRGDLVLLFEVEQPDALSRTASSADRVGIDADDLAVLADHHKLRAFVDQQNCRDLTVPRCCFEVDDPLTAAGLQSIFV